MSFTEIPKHRRVSTFWWHLKWSPAFLDSLQKQPDKLKYSWILIPSHKNDSQFCMGLPTLIQWIINPTCSIIDVFLVVFSWRTKIKAVQFSQPEFQFSSIQAFSCVCLFAPHGLQHAGLPCQLPHWSLLKHMSIELVMPSNHFILCCPLFLPPSIFPSIRVFSNESVLCIRWPEQWSFSYSISSSNEYSGPISFRMDWLELFAVQGTLKSLLQHHSSKASIIQCSAFFMVQLSTTGKTTAMTRWQSNVSAFQYAI